MLKPMRTLCYLLLPACWLLPLDGAHALPFIDGDKGGVKYEVVVQGTDNDELHKWLREVSRLVQHDDEPPASVALLEKRAGDDLPELLKALHALGYYSAVINVEIEAEETPVQVNYVVDAGPVYLIAKEHLSLSPTSPEGLELPDLSTLEPAIGKPAVAEALLAGAAVVRGEIAKLNCVLSVEVTPAIRLTEDETAEVFYEVEAGAIADFGALSISGNESVEEDAIRRHIPWREGECFNAALLDKTEADLRNTQLYATVNVRRADDVGADGRVPMQVEVTERFHRTVKAGVSYMTSEGPGVSAGWEHRNILGAGEKLELSGVLSTLEYSATADFTKPYFFHKDQDLKLGARIAREEVDAYTSDNTSITAMIERRLNARLRVGGGVGYRLSQVEDESGTETYGLIFTPLFAAWDNRDNPLDPRRGVQARLDTAPYFDTLGTHAGFVRNMASASTYVDIPAMDSVLAFRGALGSISGSSTASIPADLRMYAGGGSSVRGYGYQELGPRNALGEPIGGRSMIEATAELRTKITDTFGAAVFIDGGNAFESEYPDFDQPLRFGAGVGVRYYTDFGPLRLDVAVPLDKQRGDSAFQLYVSLGQAF